MNTFYAQLSNLNNSKENMIYTILTGEKTGRHALYENGHLCAETDAFFKEHPSLFNQKTTGISEAGGSLVFCEKLGSQKKMVIMGGGFVSMPVIRIAKMIGFHVTVLEDRPLFADHAREAGADHVICNSFTEALNEITGDLDTYFVIVTRGHRYDMECLESLLLKSSAYIGMMGSRLRVQKAKEVLREKGYEAEILEKLHAPIGLSISAETPEEIAVSIMAEVIAVKNKNQGNVSFSKEILKALQSEGGKVLVTIIERKGSAPRAIGTRMLVLEDGRTIGTIGGGCAEADITRQALLMMREGVTVGRIAGIDMTGREAEDDGMVCGGRIRVFMEPVSDDQKPEIPE